MSERPLVSLCVPTYGRAAFIGETINSALKQTVTDFEIIVVDDVSPDNTGEVVARFDDRRIAYYRNAKNLGVPENLNYALSLAQGEYMLILEDHDLLEPTYLEKTLSIMQRYPSVGFVASGLVTIDVLGQTVHRYVEDWPEFLAGRWLLRRLLTRTDCPFSVTTVMRREMTKSLDPLFDARYWWYADQHLWLRLAAKSDFGYVAEPLLRFRERETEHYLADRFWESVLCVDRIHGDNWSSLHPRASVAAAFDGAKYEQAKFKTIAGMRLGKLTRSEPWTSTDREHTRQYLRQPSRWLLAGLGLVPAPIWAAARRRWHQARRNQTEMVSQQDPALRAEQLGQP